MKVLALIRVRQWIKNLLILFPPLIAIKELELEQGISVLLGFVAWCLIASAGYVLNDLLDREADRGHPIKRRRPLASGAVSARAAVAAMLLLFAGGMGLGFSVGMEAFGVLLVYAASSVSYTLALKRVKYIDVVLLTMFYVLRLFMGSYASGVEMSHWFVLTCYFTFLSLALNKRYLEIRLVDAGKLSRRDYSAEDYQSLKMVSYISSYVAVVFAMLYMVFSIEMVSPIHYVVFLVLATTIQLSFFDDRVVETDDPIEKLKRRPVLIVALAFMMLYVIFQKYYA